MKSKRQNEILKILLMEHSLKTEDLVNRFGVSIETIRRDINTMEQEGLVKKVYGGIRISSDSLRVNALESWNNRLEHCHSEKVKIVTRALELIADNSVIALDIGTTTYELSRLLGAKKNLCVITNSLLIASELAKNTSHNTYCIGGLVMPSEIVTSGVFARNFLNSFASIDMFLVGADGLTIKNGITEFNEAVVEIKQQIAAIARQTVLLADHSKFGKEALFKSCALDDVDVLVTDELAPKKELDMLRKINVEVIVAT